MPVDGPIQERLVPIKRFGKTPGAVPPSLIVNTAPGENVVGPLIRTVAATRGTGSYKTAFHPLRSTNWPERLAISIRSLEPGSTSVISTAKGGLVRGEAESCTVPLKSTTPSRRLRAVRAAEIGLLNGSMGSIGDHVKWCRLAVALPD